MAATHVIDRLRQLLAKAGDDGVATAVSCADAGPVPAQLVATGTDLALVRFAASGPARAVTELQLSVNIDGRPRNFRPPTWTWTRGELTIHLPDRLRVAQRRATARIAAPTTAEVLMAVGDNIRRRPIIDFAGAGLGVAVLPGDPHWSPGTPVERLRFALPIGEPILTSGTVKHTREVEVDGTPRQVVGIELGALSPGDGARLAAWVRGNSGPRARERRVLAGCRLSEATLRHDDRERHVLHLTPTTVDVALDEADDRVVEGQRWEAELWIEEERVAAGVLAVVSVQRHRGRPVRASLSWATLPGVDRRRLTRLLEPTAPAAATGK